MFELGTEVTGKSWSALLVPKIVWLNPFQFGIYKNVVWICKSDLITRTFDIVNGRKGNWNLRPLLIIRKLLARL